MEKISQSYNIGVVEWFTGDVYDEFLDTCGRAPTDEELKKIVEELEQGDFLINTCLEAGYSVIREVIDENIRY